MSLPLFLDRRFVKDHSDDDIVTVVSDVKVEVLFGLFLAIVGSVLMKAH